MTVPVAQTHAELMDDVYRWQRHFYDVTRKYYLLGRDRTIRGMELPEHGSMLEIGCGTGRNLALAQRMWPDAALFGLDISPEMLKTATARLDGRAVLAAGDAARFDAASLFGRDTFDRVMLSYCTSMIPQWERAVTQACGLVGPGGSLHIIDFGTMAQMPGWLRRGLGAWLARFHVTPRGSLCASAFATGAKHGLAGEVREGPGGYYQVIVLRRSG